MSFVLVAVFVPMSAVVLKENSQITLLENEKIGAAFIPQVQQINILLAQHRGTSNRFLLGNRNLQKQLEDLETQLDSAFATQIIQCQKNIALFIPCSEFEKLNQKWQALKEQYLLSPVQESFFAHSDLIVQMRVFLVDVADHTNLSLDDQLSTFYLMDSMVEKIPDLVERIGKLRGFASGVIVSSHQSSMAEQVHIAELVYSVRESQKAVNLQMTKVFTLLPVFEEMQQSNLLKCNQEMEIFLNLVGERIIPHKDKSDDQDFYTQASNVITQVMQLYSPVVDALNYELDNRIHALLVKRYAMISGGLFFILLLSGFALYFKKRLSVLNHAIVCFEQISKENYDYPITIQYQDEIGQLLNALTLMQHRLANNVEELKRSITQLTHAQRIAQLGDWEWNLAKNQLKCSDETYRIFNIDSQNFQWHYDTFLDFVKPADRENVAAIFSEAKRCAGNYDLEYRLNINGTKKIIHQCIESHANDTGKVIYMIGTVQDVTLQREMESRIRLTAQVFDHVGEAIVVTDENNKVILINNVFSQITGYKPEEIIGQNPKFLSSGEQTAEFYKKMWSDILQHGIWKGEVWNQRKDGALYAEMLTITTMCNAEGEIINYIGIFFDITTQKRAAEQIAYLAHYDSLTKLMNRTSLQAAVQLAIIEAQQSNHLLALLFIDLDGFKAVNDTLGHDVGDNVLKNTAEYLRKNVRERDIVARLGGDEFVVVLTNLMEVNHILPIAEKIVLALNQTITHDAKTLYVSPSIGISVLSEHCDDYETLLNKADKAMYSAKTNGKNNFQFAAL